MKFYVLLLLILYVLLVLTQSVYIIPWISKCFCQKKKTKFYQEKKIIGSNYWTKCSQTKNAKILYKYKKYNLGKWVATYFFTFLDKDEGMKLLQLPISQYK